MIDAGEITLIGLCMGGFNIKIDADMIYSACKSISWFAT